jgi:hypothetical protein
MLRLTLAVALSLAFVACTVAYLVLLARLRPFVRPDVELGFPFDSAGKRLSTQTYVPEAAHLVGRLRAATLYMALTFAAAAYAWVPSIERWLSSP